MASSPYKTQDTTLLKEIQAAAELRLQSQLTAALAADQRALIFAGFSATGAAALAGAAASVLTSVRDDYFLGWVSLVAALGLLIAMGLATYAARPTTWYFPGTSPENWLTDIAANKVEADRLPESIEDYQNRITENEKLMKNNGRVLVGSNVVALVAILASSLTIAFH